MSATDQMRQMLDQLMGTARNGEFLFLTFQHIFFFLGLAFFLSLVLSFEENLKVFEILEKMFKCFNKKKGRIALWERLGGISGFLF